MNPDFMDKLPLTLPYPPRRKWVAEKWVSDKGSLSPGALLFVK